MADTVLDVGKIKAKMDSGGPWWLRLSRSDVDDLCDDVGKWRQLALHALHDLRMLGVPVEQILGMTPDVLEQLADYDRDMTSYS